MSDEDNLKKIFKEMTDREKLFDFIHEVRTPFTIIRGYANLLARIKLDDPSTFPEDYNYMVEALSRANDRIGLLLDTLMSVLREESTK